MRYIENYSEAFSEVKRNLRFMRDRGFCDKSIAVHAAIDVVGIHLTRERMKRDKGRGYDLEKLDFLESMFQRIQASPAFGVLLEEANGKIK